MNDFTQYSKKDYLESIKSNVSHVKSKIDNRSTLSGNGKAQLNYIDALKYLLDYFEFGLIKLHDTSQVYVDKERKRAAIFNQNEIYISNGETKEVSQYKLKDFKLQTFFENYYEVSNSNIVYPAKVSSLNLFNNNEKIEISEDKSLDPDNFSEVAKQIIFDYNNLI
ncbi:hypothetical protein [Staphylococcus sp. GDX8P66P]|uniref:hypothetical protein n=1 Tax=Staphylococcus sp. GDX8P66P TaxID=2804102 RepID=UPI001AEC54E5|nr:hypothetical protein [Staphylococcus sp. GDX8P66P]